MKEMVMELLNNKQYAKLKILLESTNNVDISVCLDQLNKEEMAIVFRLLDKDDAVEVFSHMESDTQERLIHVLSDKELSEVTQNLFIDDAVDLISEMPAVVVKRILKTAGSKQRRWINELLKYPEDSAGSIMTIEFVDLKRTMTVQEAFDRIRKTGVDKETIYTCYVTDEARHLVGVVTVKALLLAQMDEPIEEVMETGVIKVNTHQDKETVVNMFDKYDFLAMPVVDMEDRLVGIITVDDAMDVMHEEVAEDFEKMAAMKPSEDGYFKTPVLVHAKNRIVWLLVLMLSAAITGTIITHYQEAFASLPILVAFIPMLMDTGGNCGSQTSTLIIRGLATEEIVMKDVLRCWWKEIRVALIVGVVLAFVNGARILVQYHNAMLAVVIGITMMCTICISKSLGCFLPMLAKKMKLDPAIMASPMITTIVDCCSILIYFNVAIHLLKI